MTLTFVLEIQLGSRGCRDTWSCEIWSSWVQRFMSYRVHKLFVLSRNGEKSENSLLW